MIKNYLHTRLRPWSFLALAALFALFDSQSGLGFVYLSNVFFLFASFLVFRLLDDAGSVYIDRAEHPERSYLYPENYPHFLKLLLFSLALYLLFIILSRVRWDFIYLSIFLLSSGLAYFIFSRRAAVIALIPLLKYPVLLGCLLAWQDDSRHLLLALSTFFLMGAHELLEKDGTVQFIWGLGSLATAGILIFPIIENPLNGLYILGSIFLILVFRKSPYRPYIPLLYYPLSYFINSQFLV